MDSSKIVELKLSVDMVNIVLAGLGKLPLEASIQVFTEIQSQANSQLADQPVEKVQAEIVE
jgi:hypothetical protein